MSKKAAPESAPENPSGPIPGGVEGVVDEGRLSRLDELAEAATAKYGGQPEAKTEDPPKVERELVNQPRAEDGKFLSKDPEAVEAAPVEAAPEPAPEVAAVVEPATAPTFDLSALVTRKINGASVTKTVEEWIAAGQKVEAAEKYLADSAKTFRELQQAGQQPQAHAVPTSTEDDGAAFVRAIQTGTEDEAKAAYARLVTSLRQPQATPEQLIPVLQPMVRQQVEGINAFQTFQSEYRDLLGDPNLSKLVFAEDEKLLQAGFAGSNLDRFRAAGNVVRKWRESIVGQSGQPTTEKQQRKASVTVIPTAAARAAGKTEDKPESPQDVIAEMAKQRQAR